MWEFHENRSNGWLIVYGKSRESMTLGISLEASRIKGRQFNVDKLHYLSLMSLNLP